MEKPLVVYSSWMNNQYNNIETQKEFAWYSNYLAQKNGYKTILYTDQKSKAILKDIPYDIIIDFDEEILNQLPKTVWAAAKILTFSMQKEPFLHIDFDFFIFEDLSIENMKDKDFIIYHQEPWSKQFGLGNVFHINGIKKVLDITNNCFNIKYNKKLMSLNFAIFGSYKKNVVTTISKEAKILIDNLIKNKDILENLNLQSFFKKKFGNIDHAMLSIIFEQVIFPYTLVQKHKIYYHPILKVKSPREVCKLSIQNKLLHLWGFKKDIKVKTIIRNKIYQLRNKY